MIEMIKMVIRNQKGQGMVEYGLILALIAVVGVAGLVILGPKISAMFSGVADSL
jgi:pilus assembly protein Flp/PilA